MPQSEYRSLDITSAGAQNKYYRLQEALKVISIEGPNRDGIEKRSSSTRGKSDVSFNRLSSLGLIDQERDGELMNITQLGEKVLDSEQAPLRLIISFCETFEAFYDTMAILSMFPVRAGQIRKVLNKSFGFDWKTNTGARERVNWLVSMDLAERNQANEYYLTAKGETCLEEIQQELGAPEVFEVISFGNLPSDSQSNGGIQQLHGNGVDMNNQTRLESESNRDGDGERRNDTHALKEWENSDELVQKSDIPSEPGHLFFPDSDDRSILKRIDDAIRSDMHVILTGPPGSGKTALAEYICEHYMGDRFEVTTATADWSTFDTVGGYRPNSDGELEFKPGIFLKRFLEPSVPEQRHEWLVIDELNRADIGKAFGSLFSALTGRTITLPFEVDDQQVKLFGDASELDDPKVKTSTYYIPSDWRLIATINTADKSSLYQIGYAFMRRFAYISVPTPSYEDLQGDEGPNTELVEEYLDCWDAITIPEADDEIWPDDPTDTDVDTPTGQIAKDIGIIWSTLLDGSDHQSDIRFGPGLIEDMLRHSLTTLNSTGDLDYAPGFAAKILPQLDGMPLQNAHALIHELHGKIEQSSSGMSKFSTEIPERTANQILSDV